MQITPQLIQSFKNVMQYIAFDNDFVESDHPRDENGKFTKTGAMKTKIANVIHSSTAQNLMTSISELRNEISNSDFTKVDKKELNHYLSQIQMELIKTRTNKPDTQSKLKELSQKLETPKTEKQIKNATIIDKSYLKDIAKLDHEGNIELKYPELTKKITQYAKKNLNAELIHSSGTVSKYESSIYLKIDDYETRISDHEIPETGERKDRGTTRWDNEIIINTFMSRQLALLETEKEFHDWIKNALKRSTADSITCDYAINAITFGKNSNRHINPGNDHLYVTDCILTSACVSEYKGEEIQGWQQFGLDANKRYGVLRPREEIAKAIDTYKGLPLLDKHIAISPEDPQENLRVGTAGTDAVMEGNDLVNTIIVETRGAIDAIEKADKGDPNGKKCLSVGYKYDIVKEDGTFDGKKYQFKMINIRANHIALVDKGRVDEAQIADQSINTKNNYLKGLSMKNTFLKTLFSWALDAKMCDSSELEKEIKEVKSKANDEFEGGAEEKKEMLDSMEEKLGEMKKKEAADKAAKDNEPKEPKEPGAKDNEPEPKKPEAKDNEPEPKKKDAEDRAIIAMDEKKIAEKASQMAMDMLRTNTEVTALCERVIGKLPEAMLYDSAEIKINKTLKIAQDGIDYSGKSIEAKTAVLETLANNKKTVRDSINYSQQFASDTAATVSKSTNPLFNLIKGVN